MKLQNMTVIFVIILIPILIVTSYYIRLQIDTTKKQTQYTEKLIDSARQSIQAYEINTVQWNSQYASLSDSKRRDVNAAINTFITSFANSLGMSRS